MAAEWFADLKPAGPAESTTGIPSADVLQKIEDYVKRVQDFGERRSERDAFLELLAAYFLQYGPASVGHSSINRLCVLALHKEGTRNDWVPMLLDCSTLCSPADWEKCMKETFEVPAGVTLSLPTTCPPEPVLKTAEKPCNHVVVVDLTVQSQRTLWAAMTAVRETGTCFMMDAVQDLRARKNDTEGQDSGRKALHKEVQSIRLMRLYAHGPTNPRIDAVTEKEGITLKDDVMPSPVPFGVSGAVQSLAHMPLQTCFCARPKLENP